MGTAGTQPGCSLPAPARPRPPPLPAPHPIPVPRSQNNAQEKEKAAVKAGKGLYHLKKSEARRLELVARYEELKASGRLDKYMEKRRKKNASKEHKHLVARRPEAGA